VNCSLRFKVSNLNSSVCRRSGNNNRIKIVLFWDICYIAWCMVTNFFLVPAASIASLYLEDGAIRLLQNVGNHLRDYMASYPRRLVLIFTVVRASDLRFLTFFSHMVLYLYLIALRCVIPFRCIKVFGNIRKAGLERS
jgi:hypothetical protein